MEELLIKSHFWSLIFLRSKGRWDPPHFKVTRFVLELHTLLQDFPFLRQHKPAKGTITMENGDMAAVCLDCFETLKNQFVEQVRIQ